MPLALRTPSRATIEIRRRLHAGIPGKKRKVLRHLHPRSLEREYARALLRFVSKLQGIILNRLIPRFPEIETKVTELRPDSSRQDQETAADLIADLMQSVNLWFDDALKAYYAETVAEDLGWQVADFNRKEIGKVFQSVLGLDIAGREPWLVSEIKMFTKTNAALITDIPRKMAADIESTMYTGLRQGMRHEAMRDWIVKDLGGPNGEAGVFQKVETRAALIARDQVSKFNGQLTSLRHRDAGVEKYIWHTAMDERVRPEHADREGDAFSWDDPPEDGHPGEPINCRCWAEPVFGEEEETEE